MVFISTTCLKFDLFSEKNYLEKVLDIERIEFSGGHDPYPNARIYDVLNHLQESGKMFLIHNYFPVPYKSFVLNFASSDNRVIARSLELAGSALELCRVFKVPYYSFHPGYLYDASEGPDGHFNFSESSFVPYNKALCNFLKTFIKLIALSEKAGVPLAVENLFVAPGNLKTSLNCSFEQLDELFQALPADTGMLIDLGHLNISSHYLGFNKYNFLENILAKYADRVWEIHLSANHGEFDEHLQLFPDDWQLDAIREFRHCPGIDGLGIKFTLEARNLDFESIVSTKSLIEKYI